MHFKRTAEERDHVMKIILIFVKSMGIGILVMLLFIVLYHLMGLVF
jgi:hypothetical protein